MPIPIPRWARIILGELCGVYAVPASVGVSHNVVETLSTVITGTNTGVVSLCQSVFQDIIGQDLFGILFCTTTTFFDQIPSVVGE